MEIIVKPTGTGKTHQLIKMCSEQGGYIVCPTMRDCERIFAFSKDIGCKIPFPISWYEFINNQFRGKGVGRVYIDDLDRCLQQGSAVPIIAATYSLSENSESQFQ
ncbi:MAG: hypothetical protein HWQ36_25925 [Nostoc sp. NMS2]|uniref:hypothetical protein n=1 Tax=Nostoc sp. NMS2 TaxID=2815389 RepID=UPI0025CB8E3E|nr:hypothetical protein [Nostoc sp. NMS2]MBN3993825.1 hypothetical protein [Nostoc sp. NMS2]